MKCVLYRTSSPPNKVSKSLKNAKEYDPIRLVDETSILNPTIEISFDDVETVATYNYMYIPKFKRYYFIKEPRWINQICYIDCICDVLMSYKTDIKNSTQLIERQQSLCNKYIRDTQAPILSTKSYIYKSFGSAFNTNETGFYLQTTGRGVI